MEIFKYQLLLYLYNVLVTIELSFILYYAVEILNCNYVHHHLNSSQNNCIRISNVVHYPSTSESYPIITLIPYHTNIALPYYYI